MGASPKGRAFSCSSLRVAHHRRRSSRASSKAWSTARCTGGTFVKVPRSHGSGSFIGHHIGESLREERRDGGVRPSLEHGKNILQAGLKTSRQKSNRVNRVPRVRHAVCGWRGTTCS